FPRVDLCDRAPDPGAGAGDERDFPLEETHLDLPFHAPPRGRHSVHGRTLARQVPSDECPRSVPTTKACASPRMVRRTLVRVRIVSATRAATRQRSKSCSNWCWKNITVAPNTVCPTRYDRISVKGLRYSPKGWKSVAMKVVISAMKMPWPKPPTSPTKGYIKLTSVGRFGRMT